MLFANLGKLANQIINKYEKSYASLGDLELTAHSLELKRILLLPQNIQNPQGLEEKVKDLLPQAFALVREAAFRELGYRHHKEQLMAGIALYRGFLAQMDTGEGKTLAITAPAFLAALAGQQVRIVTANDYLAARDCRQMGGVYARLGVNCSVITTDRQFRLKWLNSGGSSRCELIECTRQEAYRAAVIYGTAAAFGFDYLRDHLALRKEDLLDQREDGDYFNILDEADNILLDEARTPLIINKKAELDISFYLVAMRMVRRLQPELDYRVDKAKRTASFTQTGITKLETWLGTGKAGSEEMALYSGNQSALFYLDNCLKAITLYNLDEDYLVIGQKPQAPSNYQDNQANQTTYPKRILANSKHERSDEQIQQKLTEELVLIDRLTGRTMPGRRLANGLHEALEAKEGLAIKPPTLTTATISLHSYFTQSKKLAGLSGTLQTDKDILRQLYGLETVVIPPHKPLKRADARPLVFRDHHSTLTRLIEAAIKVIESGAPVLIGTPSVRASEEVSAYLDHHNIAHQVLNARQNEKEAHIIARAGYPGRITVATNMAGRGTDIPLGGRYLDHLQDLANQRGFVREADEGSPAWQQLEDEARARHARAREIVYRAGGLHVLGLGLQTSRRLDRQLIGRAGRQGDPGYSQFFYSLDDELVVRYVGESGAYRRLVSSDSVQTANPDQRNEELNSTLP